MKIIIILIIKIMLIIIILFFPIYKQKYTEHPNIKHRLGTKIGEGCIFDCYEDKFNDKKIIKVVKELNFKIKNKTLYPYIKIYNLYFYPLIIKIILEFSLQFHINTVKRMHNMSNSNLFAKIYEIKKFYYIQEKMTQFDVLPKNKLQQLKKTLKLNKLNIGDLHSKNIMSTNGNVKIIDCKLSNIFSDFFQLIMRREFRQFAHKSNYKFI
jgi:hypothetical protein